MPEPYLVKPDREFLRRILDEGGEDLKKCYQCATCSVVCELSDGKKPFPRKEMIWAQWGLKDRLVGDPDIWLCHQCNDCSTRCPRGARPGDVLAALRQQSVQHFAVPRFLGSWVNQLKFLPLMLLAPVVLLALALAVRGPVEEMLSLEGHRGFYAGFFPHWLLIGFFSFFTGLAFLGAAVGVVRFWRAMKAADELSGRTMPATGILSGIIRTVKSIFSHDRFGKCESQGSRRLAHLAAFYGFLALFVVTVWALIDLYALPVLFKIGPYYPFGLLHPMKILANVGCAVLIFGCVRAIADRMAGKEEAGASTAFDWIFVGLLLGVAVTGLLSEILRFAADPGEIVAERTAPQLTAFAVYFVHLVLVFDLLVYLPYSKFAHVLYRTVALVYAEHSGRHEVGTQKA